MSDTKNAALATVQRPGRLSVAIGEQFRLEGRAIHAELRAAAAEKRLALATLRAMLDGIPQVAQAKRVVAQAETDLARAARADAEFRERLGEELGMDLSDASALDVNWESGTITVGSDSEE